MAPVAPGASAGSNETEALRACLRDIVALSALPAVWRGFTPQSILESLADAVLVTIRPELLHVRFREAGQPVLSVTKFGSPPPAELDRASLSRLLDGPDDLTGLPASIKTNSGVLHLARAPLGSDRGEGTVVAGSHRPGFPSEQDRIILSFASGQAAIALQGALVDMALSEHAKQERETREDLETLHRVGHVLSSELGLEEMVQAATDAATRVSGAAFGAFFHNALHEEGEDYLLYGLSGGGEDFERVRLPRNTPMFELTFRDAAVVRLGDVTKDQRYGNAPPFRGLFPQHLPVRSYLAVPVQARNGEVMGGLFFGHSEPDVFTERAERLVTGIATQAAIALDNARLYRQLQGTLQIREHFLAAAAHDLKTPVASASAMAQLLRRRAIRLKDEEAGALIEGLAGIEGIVRGMGMQIDELLDVSRLEMGHQLELERRPTDLLALVNRVVAEQQPAGDAILVDCSVPELTGSWDETRLFRVVRNLVSNALKYSPEGRKVTIKLWQESGRKQQQAVLSVSDRGIGIPQADLPHLFEPFYRARNAVGRMPGTGIGLSSVRSIVEGHGGTVQVESVEGAGSTFTIRLPLAGE